MPLVKGTQKKVGRDKFDVLMLSIDHSYGMPIDAVIKSDKESMRDAEVNWPNVVLPHGFTDVKATFNTEGYGLILIDPKGIVRDTNVTPDTLEPLLGQILNMRIAKSNGDF
jgi:hypothetical protein